jgi:hypothetical protein
VLEKDEIDSPDMDSENAGEHASEVDVEVNGVVSHLEQRCFASEADHYVATGDKLEMHEVLVDRLVVNRHHVDHEAHERVHGQAVGHMHQEAYMLIRAEEDIVILEDAGSWALPLVRKVVAVMQKVEDLAMDVLVH